MIAMLHVLESLADFGGTPRKMLYLTKHMDRDRYKLIFLLFGPLSKDPRFESLEFEFTQYGAVIRTVDAASPLRLIWKIGSEAKRSRADLIGTHTTRGLIAGYLASKGAGLPLIHHEHCSAHYRRGIGRMMAKFCLPRAEAILCNSNYTLETIRRVYPGASKKLHMAYNPVEERRITGNRERIREEIGAKPEEILIGHVGGMIPQRDQGTLIRAFYRVRTEVNHTKLVLMGDGPVRPNLESLVRTLGLDRDVIFTGYTRAVGEYLSALDIYVNPTLDEGFGIAVVEAMLSKLPVILSDRGAHPELIVEGESGYLYRGGDAESLAARIKFLMEHPEKRIEIGTKACERAKDRFSPPSYVLNYLQMVEKILRN